MVNRVERSTLDVGNDALCCSTPTTAALGIGRRFADWRPDADSRGWRRISFSAAGGLRRIGMGAGVCKKDSARALNGGDLGEVGASHTPSREL